MGIADIKAAKIWSVGAYYNYKTEGRGYYNVFTSAF